MKKTLFSLLCACAIIFASCKKDEEKQPDPVPATPAVPSRNYTTVSTFVGSTTAISGSTDATGTAARFRYVGATVQDAQGNLYVTDIDNHTIRKVTSAGVVTTFAGTVGSFGGNDGTGTAAKFYSPYGLTIDASGNLYVSEFRGHRIRKITPAGVVTTVAGNGTLGRDNGTGASARFNEPISLALDNAGNLFVSDLGNNLIRKIALATGVVTTLAGGGTQDNLPYDGQGTAALFVAPQGICIDTQNNLYVADNTAIRKITPTGLVSTIAGASKDGGFVNGAGNTARFKYIFGICRDAAGFLYVADRETGSIRRISPEGVVSDFAGLTASMFAGGASPIIDGDADGSLTTARFRFFSNLYMNPQNIIFVGEEEGHRVRKIE